MVRVLANFVFSLILNIVKGIRCSYNINLSPRTFKYLFSSNIKKLQLNNATIGSGVTLSDGCAFFHQPQIYGNVTLGRYTSINGPGTRICAEVTHIQIGSFCSIASNVTIQEFNHNYKRASTYFIRAHVFGLPDLPDEIISKGPVIIKDDVWIGSNSVILSGVTIGRGAIVGAGSIVTRDVEPYTVVGGNPAKKIRNRFSDETIAILERSEWWTWDEQKMLANQEFFKVNRS